MSQPYHPDDLKGKGEPSYTYEKDLKEERARLRKSGIRDGARVGDFEMQPQAGGTRKDRGAGVRQRSVSSAAGGRPASPPPANATSSSSGIGRSNTTGKRLSDGLKRRFGSIRRRKDSEDA